MVYEVRNGSTLLMEVTTNNITVTVALLKHTRGIFIWATYQGTCAVHKGTTVIRKSHTKHIFPLSYQKSGVTTVSHWKTFLLTQPRTHHIRIYNREHYLLIGWSFLGAIFISLQLPQKGSRLVVILSVIGWERKCGGKQIDLVVMSIRLHTSDGFELP